MKMNRTLVVGIVAVGVVIGIAYFFFGPARSTIPVAEPLPIVPDSEIPAETISFWSASDEEVQATFTATDVTVTEATLGTVTLRQVDSGSGGLYTNDTETITLWDRGDKITIWQGETMLFEGYGEKPTGDVRELSGTVWTWERLSKSDGTEMTPKTPDTFSLTFEEGRVSGTTDCNSFSGAYTVVGTDTISFGPLASTKMYCEGSEEDTFTGALGEVDQFKIDASGTLFLFLKNESGSLELKPKV